MGNEAAPGRLRDAWSAFAGNARNPDLRRAQAAFGLLWASEWAFMVALSVVAFRDGGATAVGLVAAARMVPAALLAPFGSALADRFPRDRTLIVSCVARAVALAACAAVTSPAAVYALAVLATAVFVVVRPAHSALLPALCQVPRELAGATVVRGLMDSAGTLVGPAAAALLLAAGGPRLVFAAVALSAAWAGVLIARVRYEPAARAAAPGRHLVREAREGVTAVLRHREARLIFGLGLVQVFTRGAIGVLVVVLALDVLETGEPGIAVLTTAIGAGAVLGSLGAGMLADGRNLARFAGLGVALWGVPLLLCAAAPEPAPVFAFLMLAGLGNALLDVGLFTLPVRMLPDELLGRVFGALEAGVALAVAAGSLAAPLLVDALGNRGALVAVGAVAPVLVAAGWAGLRRIDHQMGARDGEIAVLRSVPMFRPLPLPAIERLASGVHARPAAAGEVVFEQGEPGDRFYVIGAGSVDVIQDGRLLRRMGPGESFGEIALLRDRPRTASVRAHTALELHALERGDFLRAVTGHRPAALEADALVERRLAGRAVPGA